MLVTILSRTTKNLIAEDTGGVMDDYGFDLTHDAKDRMTGWDRDTANTGLDSQDWTLSFEADWDESTLTDGGVGTTQTRTHDAAHQLLTLDPDGAGGVSELDQTHDAKGSLTADGQGVTVTYDFDNMPSRVVVSSSSATGQEGTHEYEYDALGRRVAKIVDTNADGTPDATTVFIYAGQQVLVEYVGGTAASSPERKFIYGNYIDEPLVLIDATGSGETTYYYHRNRQYSVVGLTDDTGVVIERYAYTAYGELTVLDANGSADADNLSDAGNPYAYTGRRIDPETGLQYFRARYYDAQLGRFLQRDPLGYPDGMNGYAGYFSLRYELDPFGLSWRTRSDSGSVLEYFDFLSKIARYRQQAEAYHNAISALKGKDKVNVSHDRNAPSGENTERVINKLKDATHCDIVLYIGHYLASGADGIFEDNDLSWPEHRLGLNEDVPWTDLPEREDERYPKIPACNPSFGIVSCLAGRTEQDADDVNLNVIPSGIGEAELIPGSDQVYESLPQGLETTTNPNPILVHSRNMILSAGRRADALLNGENCPCEEVNIVIIYGHHKWLETFRGQGDNREFREPTAEEAARHHRINRPS